MSRQSGVLTRLGLGALGSCVAAPAIVLALTEQPASALSCAQPQGVLAEAPQAFTGRIVDADDGRLLVQVGQEWWGEPVEDRVWLRVDLAGYSQWTEQGEIPDGYASSFMWLFAPQLGTDGQLRVNPCTAWRAHRDEIEALTPAQARVSSEGVNGSSLTPASPGVDSRDAMSGDREVSADYRALVGGAGGAVLATSALGWVLVHHRKRTQDHSP